MQTIHLITPEETRALRHLVLWPHIDREEDCVLKEDGDKSSFHLGVVEDGRLCSVASFFEMATERLAEKKQYRLRAMATHPEYRNRGFAAQLIHHAIEILKEREQDILWCNARINACGFYERLGFSSFDDVFEIPHIGKHKVMWLSLC